MSAAFAHAHVAAIGWAVMMVVGLSYRLSDDRSGGDADAHLDGAQRRAAGGRRPRPAIGLVRHSAATLPGAILILAGFGSFLAHVRDIVKRKLPPPAALPRPDWATWQTHVAFGWLLLAAITGLVLTLPISLA